MSTNADQQIDDEVDQRLTKMMKERPTDVILWVLVQMGKLVVESNADTMDMKTSCTLDGQRYEVKAKITTKKVKNKT